MTHTDTSTLEELEPGDCCPQSDCKGHMDIGETEGCSCHISAPCSACENSGLVCDECGFDTAEDWKDSRRRHAELQAKEEHELAKIEARLRAEKRGKRRDERTSTHTANAFNSTPFTVCCGVAAINTGRCPNCEALITHHDDGLAARRSEVGPGNCLMCGKSRAKALQPGGCCC